MFSSKKAYRSVYWVASHLVSATSVQWFVAEAEFGSGGCVRSYDADEPGRGQGPHQRRRLHRVFLHGEFAAGSAC